MNEMFTFDDVLIVPKFSMIESRKETDLFGLVSGVSFELPIISANMDTVTGAKMAHAMNHHGAMSCLHRFGSIQDTVDLYREGRTPTTLVSIGLGGNELERAEALYSFGAYRFVIDVAHGAQMSVVKQVKALHELIGTTITIMVGNFASLKSVEDFKHHLGKNLVDSIKVGIGPGSACTTRIKTGVGYPQLSAVMEIARGQKLPVIADGGMRTPGDICKALAAGAQAVMLGGMLAGTDETPGMIVDQHGHTGLLEDGMWTRAGSTTKVENVKFYKKYRGSASKESYAVQGKDTTWRTAEGESFTVPYKGPVSNVIQDIEGGLRSSMTYVGASNLAEFREKAEFVRITSATSSENGAHGKRQ